MRTDLKINWKCWLFILLYMQIHKKIKGPISGDELAEGDWKNSLNETNGKEFFSCFCTSKKRLNMSIFKGF